MVHLEEEQDEEALLSTTSNSQSIRSSGRMSSSSSSSSSSEGSDTFRRDNASPAFSHDSSSLMEMLTIKPLSTTDADRVLESPAPSHESPSPPPPPRTEKSNLRHIFTVKRSEANAELEAQKRERTQQKAKNGRSQSEPPSQTSLTSSLAAVFNDKDDKDDKEHSSNPAPPPPFVNLERRRSSRLSHQASSSRQSSSNSVLVETTVAPAAVEPPRGPFRLREFSVGRHRQQSPSTRDEENMPASFTQQTKCLDPSEPDPSRLALADQARKSFEQPQQQRRKRRRMCLILACVVLVMNLVVVAVLVPVLGRSSSSSDVIDEGQELPTTPLPSVEEGWQRTPSPTTDSPTVSPSWAPSTVSPTLPTMISTELYCFPPMDRRSQFTMWDYTIQVKQDLHGRLCGPEDNRFQRSTVHVDQDDELRLQFTRRTASEIRIVLPGGEPFTYGTYAFSVKSVTVYDANRNVLGDTLPKELVLGFFTWDDKEAYLTYENYHHEVDIEISQWNKDNNADVQFLVQQPGIPQAYRFSSGLNGAYDQGGHWYNFTWNPGRIDWYTSAGGGQQATLTTAKAIQQEETDYIQCLPGQQVDVRMNLWNMLGAQTPVGLQFFDMVEVVIDNFVFEPSGEEYVPDGGLCSKDCQCRPDFACFDNRCAPISFDPDYVLPDSTGQRPSTPFYCGCPSCIQSIWDTPAPTIYQTCGERITWYQQTFPVQYPNEAAACVAVAEEFPCICGQCHSPTCQLDVDAFASVCSPTMAPTMAPTHTISPTVMVTSSPTADIFTTDLYCFPNQENRVEYSAWGGSVIQVKQNPGLFCGPMNNRFSDSTVSVTGSGALRMQFTRGTASEVRILLSPDRLPYGYGKFSFLIQSVSVRSASGQLLSQVLPKDLVLAMFTWEETNDANVYNNEIAIQLSRTGVEDGSDLLFALQPSGYMRRYRSFSGSSNTYSQGGHWYNITWLPGRVEWSTDAGGGQSASLTTERALVRNQPDHIRCPPPRNLEVRLNLWNTQGAQQPLELAFTDVVEVEIDQFVYEPATQTSLPDESVCSRDCQCGDSSKCVNNICTAL